jgi:hypothetical protein
MAIRVRVSSSFVAFCLLILVELRRELGSSGATERSREEPAVRDDIAREEGSGSVRDGVHDVRRRRHDHAACEWCIIARARRSDNARKWTSGSGPADGQTKRRENASATVQRGRRHSCTSTGVSQRPTIAVALLARFLAFGAVQFHCADAAEAECSASLLLV